MRVLLFVETLTIGGLPNYVLELGRALTEAGDAVALAHAGDTVPTHLELAGVTLLNVKAAQWDTPSAALASWAPDVIHVHLCSDHGLLSALSSLDVPMIRSFHDYTSLCLRRGRRRFPGDRCQRALGRGCVAFGCSFGAPNYDSRLPGLKSISLKLAERSAYQRFDASVVGSVYMHTTLTKNGFLAANIHLVPYFSKFDRDALEANDGSPKPPAKPSAAHPLKLLFTGQAVVGKGLRVLVDALATLDGHWHLTVVAEGPELASVRLLTQRLNISQRVTFTGWVAQSELRKVYQSADLLVIPSVWDDPGPLVGLEALSMGTPVLGFPVGGIPDYAIDGHTGFLAASVSTQALTEALRRALVGVAALASMGRNGQALIVERHSRRGHVDKIRAIYSGVRLQRQSRLLASKPLQATLVGRI